MNGSIYLAAYYGRWREMQGYRTVLEGLGFQMTSRWINGTHEMLEGRSTVEQSIQLAEEDIEDMFAADILIHFTDGITPNGSRGRGGRHVEFGWMLFRKRYNLLQLSVSKAGRGTITAVPRRTRIIICGPRENVFHYLPEVEHFETWDALEARLTNEVMGDQ